MARAFDPQTARCAPRTIGALRFSILRFCILQFFVLRAPTFLQQVVVAAAAASLMLCSAPTSGQAPTSEQAPTR